MKLACSTWMMPGEKFYEKIKKAAEYGFEGVEIRLFESEASSERIKEILTALNDNGLEPCSLIMPGETYRKPLLDEETKQAKIELSKKALDAAAELGCPTIVCPEYGAQNPLPLFDHPRRPDEKVHGLLIDFLSEVGEYAENIGAKATIEPINRYETRFYYTLEDGRNVLNEVGKKSIYLLADFFHMNMEERDIAESIKANGDMILHVHLGDSNRYLPGQGHLNFKPGFKALQEIGYDRFMALECSITGNPEVVIPESIRFMRETMA